LPYIFRDSSHAYKVLDGKVGQSLLDELGKAKAVRDGWRPEAAAEPVAACG